MDSIDERPDNEETDRRHDRSISKHLGSVRQCRFPQVSVRSLTSEVRRGQFKGDEYSNLQPDIREASLIYSNTR